MNTTALPRPRRARHIPLVALAGALAPSAAGDLVSFDGSCDGNWHTCCAIAGGMMDNNWDHPPEAVCPPFPGPGDDVSLGGFDVVLNVPVGADIMIRSLISGGSLSHNGNTLVATESVELADYTFHTGQLIAESVTIGGTFEWVNGTLESPTTIMVDGPMNVTGFSSGIVNSLVVVDGPVEWSDGGFVLTDLGDDVPSAQIELLGDVLDTASDVVGGNHISNGPGDQHPAFRIFGSYTKDAGGTTTIASPVDFDMLGTATINAGTLRLSGGGLSAGRWTTADGTSVLFVSSDPYVLDDETALTGDGDYRIFNNVTVADGIIATVENLKMFSAGVLDGGGTLQVDGTFDWDGGTLLRTGATGDTCVSAAGTLNVGGIVAIPRSIDARVLVNRGVATVANGVRIQCFHGALVENRGLWNVAGGEAATRMTSGAGGGRFDNPGALLVGEGPGAARFEVPFDSSGTIAVTSDGRLDVRGGGTITGEVSLSAAGMLRIDALSSTAVFTLDGVETAQGVVQLVSGVAQMLNTVSLARFEILLGDVDVVGDLGVTDFRFCNGRMLGAGTTVVTGTAAMGDGPFGDLLTIDGHEFTNAGTATWDRDDIDLVNIGAIRNVGVWNDVGEEAKVMITSDASFTVFENGPGAVYDKTGPNTSAFDISVFRNEGTVSARAGTLRFLDTFVQLSGGRIRAIENGTVHFVVPTFIIGGRIEGRGVTSRYIASLNMAGGKIAPGTDSAGVGPADGNDDEPIGALNLTGSCEMGPDAAMEIDLAGTAPGVSHDVLVATGPVVLDGTLELRVDDEYVPAQGDAYTIVEAASVGGTFAAIDAPELEGLAWSIGYEPGSVTVTIVPAGDVDGDGAVDFADLLAVLAAWGACPPPPDGCPADVDGNGTVGFADLLVVLAGWTGG